MDFKGYLQSNTVRGILVMLVTGLVALFGKKFDFDVTTDEIDQIVTAIVLVVSAVWAVIGRKNAKQPIKLFGGEVKTSKILLIVLLIPILGIGASGCGDNIKPDEQTQYENNAFNVLNIAHATYDTNMKALVEVYRGGLVTDEQMVPIMKVAQILHDALDVADNTFLEYKKIQTLESENRLTQLLLDLPELMGNFVAIIKPYLPKEEV